jgi:spore maturation protein CgeB
VSVVDVENMARNLKLWLREFRWANNLNAYLKSASSKRQYQETVEYYRHKRKIAPMVPVCSDDATRSGGTKVRRIFFLGTDEQQDRSGLLQALERLGRVAWFTRADGSYGQNDPVPYKERRANNTRRLLELVDRLAAQGAAPDVLIAQTWGSLIDPAALSRIRDQYGTFIINISMDDRHQFWGQKVDGEWNGVYPLIPHIDLALTAAPECVEWYEKEGCPAMFFPEASDPTIFHPMPEFPKIHDVSFVGGRYGIREELVMALRRAGITVTAYGQGWEGGRLATKDVPRLFAQSKIVLGIGTIGHCRDFYALKLRDFDSPMSGSCYLTHDNPDLRELYVVGQEIVTYTSIEECVERARSLLANDAERESIARRGRQRAEHEHTWDNRFRKLMDKIMQATR